MSKTETPRTYGQILQSLTNRAAIALPLVSKDLRPIAEMIREIDLAVRQNYYKEYPDELQGDLIQLCKDVAETIGGNG